MSTHNTRDGIEERFYKEFFIVQNHPISGKLKVLKGTKSYEDIANWWHQELQKAREEERELIVRLATGLIFTEIIGEISAKAHVDGLELHTVIKKSLETALEITKQDQSELDQPTV